MEQVAQRTWWKRNQAWVIAVTIGGGMLLSLVLILGFVFNMMKSSDAYQMALRAARVHPAVTAALGTPIEPGFLFSGNIKVSGPSGYADIAIPLNGPNGSGTVYCVAEKSTGVWSMHQLVFEDSKSGQRTDLLVPQGNRSDTSPH
jgi:hypothetical protein